LSETPPSEPFPQALAKDLFIFGGERVFGTHLYPVKLFFETAGDSTLYDPSTFTQVIREVPTAGSFEVSVVLTRMSGLFVRVPEAYRAGSGEMQNDLLETRIAITEQVADAMNQVICELALLGITSDPASPIEIGMGFLDQGRAGIASSGSDQNQRVMDPVVRIFTEPPPRWFGLGDSVPETRLEGLEKLHATRKLLGVSDALPAFIAAAYALFRRRLLAEALVDGWIVIEQVVNWLWRQQYKPRARNSAHRKRLDDTRSFNANTRLETLLAAGGIEPTLYDALQAARKYRNDTAHGAHVDLTAATTVLEAMHQTIEFVCDRSVAHPYVQQFVLG
jgi:hypothetical protein